MISDTETTGSEVLNSDENNEEEECGEKPETNAGELSDCTSGQGIDQDTEQACTEGLEGLRLTKCEGENKNEEEEELNLDEQISPQGKGTHLHLEPAHKAHHFLNENVSHFIYAM